MHQQDRQGITFLAFTAIVLHVIAGWAAIKDDWGMAQFLGSCDLVLILTGLVYWALGKIR